MTIHVPEQAAMELDEFRGTPEQERRFAEFHARHPMVWIHFERFALQLIADGVRRYSADAVMHRVRWETRAGSKDGFKVNNNWVAFYSRMWRQNHPTLRHLFAVRKQRVRPAAQPHHPSQEKTDAHG